MTSPRSAGRRIASNEYVWAGLAIAVMVGILFSPVFRHHGTQSAVHARQQVTYPWVDPDRAPSYDANDQADYVHPRQVFLDRALSEDGELPLWNPLTFSGHPFFAESGSRLAYPPLIGLTLLADPTWTHDLYLMLHLFVAGMAAFAMMKQFGARFAGALLTAVAWAFSSYGLLYYSLEMFAAVAALLPLVVLCVRRWHDTRSWAPLLLGGLLLGILFLGTSVELAFMSFLFGAAYATALALSRLAKEWRDLDMTARLALVLAPVALVGSALAVAAVGLLPFLDLAGRAGRTASKDLYPPARPADFLRAFIPPDTPLSFRAALTQPVFVGTATALLALFGAARRRPGAGLGRALVIVLLLFTIRAPVTSAIFDLVPGVRSIHGLGRALFLFDLGLAILGGIGLDALLSAVRARLEGGRLGAGAWRTSITGAVAAVCILVTFGQLFWFGRTLSPFQRREPELLFPPTPATEAARTVLESEAGSGRLLPVVRESVPIANGSILPAATGMALDLPVEGGYEPVLPQTVSSLWRVMSGEPVSSVRSVKMPDTAVNARTLGWRAQLELLPRLGVAAVLAPPGMAQERGWEPDAVIRRGLRLSYSGPDGTVYEVVDRVPRALVVPDATLVSSDDEALTTFVRPEFDVRRNVILPRREGKQPQSPPESASESPPAATPPPATVQWNEDRPNRVLLTVDTPRAGWLVLLDSWDPGWRATVDGKSTEVLRADYGFRAVPVPAGASTVTFSYRPTQVLVGAWISCISVVAILGTCAFLLRRRRRTAQGQEAGVYPTAARLPTGSDTGTDPSPARSSPARASSVHRSGRGSIRTQYRTG